MSRLVADYVEANKPVFCLQPGFRSRVDSAAVHRVLGGGRADRRVAAEGTQRSCSSPGKSGRSMRAISARSSPSFCRGRIGGRSSRKKSDDCVVGCSRPRRTYKLSGVDAVKEGVKAVLCSPGFLLIEEPTGDATSRNPSPTMNWRPGSPTFSGARCPMRTLQACRRQQAARAENTGRRRSGG